MDRDDVIIRDIDTVDVYVKGEFFINCTGKQLSELVPNWTRKISVGDIIATDEGEKRVLEITTNFSIGQKAINHKLIIG